MHVYKDYYPPVKGGIENHLNLLCNGLKDRGVDVQVIVSNRCNKFEIDTFNGISVAKVPQWGRFYSAPITPSFHLYLKAFGKDADIIHFHHPNPTAEFSYLFSKLNKKKLIVTYHSDIIRQDKLGKLYAPFRVLFLNKADRILATSPNYIQSSSVLNKYRHKCTVIPLGIDTRRFSSADDALTVAAIKGRYGDKPIILFVGCFRYYKGLPYLISAMKSIDARLLLIGNGPEYAKLFDFVERMHLNDKIKFLGELSDDEVNAYYKACDIFVLPSHLRSEAFGLVQLEAMCCRKPVISTELGTGTSFVNVNQQTGLTVRPNDVGALSTAIQYLIHHPEKRTLYGENGFKRVNRLFTADVMVESILELYEELLQGEHRAHLQSIGEPSRKERRRDRQIKVLRVVSRLNIGGPSIHVKNLTEAIDQNKFLTKLVTGSISPDEGDMSYITQFQRNVRVTIPELQREINLFKDLVALFKVGKLIRQFDPDIIHSHTSKAGTVARIAALVSNAFRAKKIIVIHTFHGNVLHGYFGRIKSFFILMIERLLATFTDRIVAISKSQKWELSSNYKICSPNKIDTIKLGFNLTPFINCEDQQGRLRERFDIPADSVLIGIVGRMAPIKKHKMFLDSAKLLIEGTKMQKITFILVGDGEERSFLEKYVHHIGIANYVIFHGWEKDIPMVYADLNILALTSLNEGTPVSVIEAMAAKVPVITTGVGGIKDLLGRSDVNQPSPMSFKICQRGILCPKDDSHAFFTALTYMIDSGYLFDRDRFSKAQDYVVKNYSVDRLVRDIEALYDRLLYDN